MEMFLNGNLTYANYHKYYIKIESTLIDIFIDMYTKIDITMMDKILLYIKFLIPLNRYIVHILHMKSNIFRKYNTLYKKFNALS